ncbi:MAG TPA: RHS repeat-associated core domain-containing protein [Solirubrobacteraceae bacterium]|nr:RHS repeat-associated core domain-containing protein [Solirubrobacteraceae bacterium]
MTGSFVGGFNGTLSGAGALVIEPGATGTVETNSSVSLNRKLINDGVFTVPGTTGVAGEEAGTFVNNATLTVNAEGIRSGLYRASGTGATPTLNNAGIVQKTEGTGQTEVAFAVNNNGAINSKSGHLIFQGGGTSGLERTGSWTATGGGDIWLHSGSFALGSEVPLSGTIRIMGTAIAGHISGSNGSVDIEGGSLTVSGPAASSVATLALLGGTVTGGGEIDVTGSFVGGQNGSIEGSGGLVIQPGATGTVATNSDFILNRALTNNGSFTVSGTSGVGGGELGRFTNNATLTVNAEGTRGGLYNASNGPVAVLSNSGLVQKTEGTGQSEVAFEINNNGSVISQSGHLIFQKGGTSGTEHAGSWTGASPGDIWLNNGAFSLGSEVPLSGAVRVMGAATAGQLAAANANLSVEGGSLTISGPGISTVRSLEDRRGTVTDVAEVDITESFLGSENATLAGQGGLIIEPGARGEVKENEYTDLVGLLVNKATFTIPVNSGLVGGEGAVFHNESTLTVNGQEFQPFGRQTGMPRSSSNAKPLLVNTGTVQKIEGTKTASIHYCFENFGWIHAATGQFEITQPTCGNEPASEYGGAENGSGTEEEKATCGEDVSCASGNLSKTQTDFAIGGRGVGLNLTRTYNSQAGVEGAKGPFGYGWTSSFSDRLTVEKASQKATLHQADGSTVSFKEATGGAFTAPAWSQDLLSGSEASGYALTLRDQTVYKFAGATGRLESVADRNGNTTNVEYDESGRLKAIADPAGRKLTLAYNAEGFVESAEDPMKHVVKYTYEAGNLASVTQPAEAGLRWQFKYDGAHQLTELTDGRGGKSTTKYSAGHQVIEQTDQMTRVTTLEYKPFETRTTNKATGAVTATQTTSTGLAAATVHGYGTASATSEISMHDAESNLLSITDGNSHTTKYTYDTRGNRSNRVDPTNHETKWTYNATHDVETETKPSGETTTYKRDSHGNPEFVERPAPGGTTQTTKYGYDPHGQQTSMEDPLKRVWKYEYDAAGNRTAEIDPEGDKRTWGYTENSQESSMVSPRGHVKAGEEAKYTTTTERDAQGRPTKVIDPLKHETLSKYDADGNLETKTDPELHVTTYTYDADNERTKVQEPNGTITETAYDGAGQVTSQTDGNKHTTGYGRNVLEQVTSIIPPAGLSHATTKEYDKAGNLTAVVDREKRTTSYKYDAANRPTEVTYSDGKTPAVKYEYNINGDRTKMEDGSGTTTYEYDQVDRLTATKDGHGNTSGYEYDLANQQAKITYPNGKAVTHGYDNAGRLTSVTDWLAHTTKFSYDANANVKAATFPTGTSNEDTYAYDETDAMKEVKMTRGAETLASLVYARNKSSQVTKATTVGLPGEAIPAFGYDKNGRLTKGAGIGYAYDAANNPNAVGGNTYRYNAEDQLEKSEATATKVTLANYTYNEVGDRTKTTPTSSPATSYAYDQADRLTTVTRPKGETTAAIEDTYAYNGDGLRTAQTVSGMTTYLAWDLVEKLPLILSDVGNSYIYGPGGLALEQIVPTGAVVYLHHDQQGSTRLLTSVTGGNVGTTTYDAYGNLVEHKGTSTTALGYDGQYTDADTGLVYLRARYFDPATSEFLTSDPIALPANGQLGSKRYIYAGDDPLARTDPTGACWQDRFGQWGPDCANNPFVTAKGAPTARSPQVVYKCFKTYLNWPQAPRDATLTVKCVPKRSGLRGCTKRLTSPSPFVDIGQAVAFAFDALAGADVAVWECFIGAREVERR